MIPPALCFFAFGHDVTKDRTFVSAYGTSTTVGGTTGIQYCVQPHILLSLFYGILVLRQPAE